MTLAAITAFPVLLAADEPLIPPSILRVSPSGLERGTTATFTLEGRNLAGAKNVIFDVPGFTAKVIAVTDVSEKITGPRAGVDTEAQVPLGKKQAAKVEITVAKDVEPGIHWFRIHTPLGTSGTAVLAVGALPEVQEPEKKPAERAAPARLITLPATLIGTIARPGDTDEYQFAGKAGQELVFQVVASELGSKLESLLILRDPAGQELAKAGENDSSADAVLTYKLPRDGNYTLSVNDRERSGGQDYFYRVNAGALPYVASVFPLQVRAGGAAEVTVTGVNLGGVHQVKIDTPKSVERWTTVPMQVKTSDGRRLDKVKVAVGNEPEMLERESNGTPGQAQRVSLPVTIDGHIDGGDQPGADADYFRFHARQGQALTIAVAASRLGSPLDSVIEVLDSQGNPIPRATLRCLTQTITTLSDRDSRMEGIRLTSIAGVVEGDYLMIGDELDQVAFVSDQPDSDVMMRSTGGLRRAFLGTSPDVHAINTPVYKVQILPPDASFPPNGLPVFRLTWRNDDGGPGYGPDSRLDFVAPKDGDYLVRLADVRGLAGTDFAYSLTIRDAMPDYQLTSLPDNPNIPQGGLLPVTVSANRLEGYEGPIEIEVKGLPKGVTASPATIPAEQASTVVLLKAGQDASPDTPPAAIQIIGRAKVNGRDLVRVANENTPLQVAAIMPPPDVVVTVEPTQIALSPGHDAKVTLHVNRQNGFKGRVPCFVRNLPPGIRIVNIGLNGILVHEDQSSRTFVLHAEEWAKPISQPIYVVAQVESNSPTLHPSEPLALQVEGKTEMASAADVRSRTGDQPVDSGSPPPTR
jgi:hypothetical protein